MSEAECDRCDAVITWSVVDFTSARLVPGDLVFPNDGSGMARFRPVPNSISLAHVDDHTLQVRTSRAGVASVSVHKCHVVTS